MQVEAIYDHGRLDLPKHIRLRRQSFRVRLEIPDHEIASRGERDTEGAQPQRAQSSVRTRIDAILGPYKAQMETSACPTRDDYRAIWHEHLEEKYLGRS